MAQKLAAELGLGVGISSGANFVGALKVQNKLGKDAVVVTVFSDDNKKHLSTDLLRQEPVKPGFLAPDIKLLQVHAFKRVCQTCCNPEECAELNYEGIAWEVPMPQCPRRPVAPHPLDAADKRRNW